MYYVYRIRSRSHPDKSFIGVSRDVKRRVKMHNAGRVEATRESGPWKLVFYAAFSRKQRAQEFEDYLKSPEGKKFGRKRLWQHLEDPDQP
ncbi:GIY-YIG nuclease family protein [Kiritimatiellaeota bacterium B1221]|nr:GIY-YIG nuclease family protein [Kiritimatiellaeota bacterium B1221]